MKYIWLLALAALAWRLFTGRWPLAQWIGAQRIGSQWLGSRSPGEQAARAKRSADARQARLLLGLDEGASRDEIIAAHRRLVAAVHPDRGGTADLVVEANAARDTLLAQIRLPETSD